MVCFWQLNQLRQELEKAINERDRYGAKAKELHQQGRKAIKKFSALKETQESLQNEFEESKQNVERLELLLKAKNDHVESLEKELNMLAENPSAVPRQMKECKAWSFMFSSNNMILFLLFWVGPYRSVTAIVLS